MESIRWISVNELAPLLAKHFGADDVFIEAVDVGSLLIQHTPRHVKVGIGGVLNIKVTATEWETK